MENQSKTKNTIATIIQDKLDEFGWKADSIEGVSGRTITRILNENHEPSVNTLKKIARSLKVSDSELLDLKKNNKANGYEKYIRFKQLEKTEDLTELYYNSSTGYFRENNYFDISTRIDSERKIDVIYQLIDTIDPMLFSTEEKRKCVGILAELRGLNVAVFFGSVLLIDKYNGHLKHYKERRFMKEAIENCGISQKTIISFFPTDHKWIEELEISDRDYPLQYLSVTEKYAKKTYGNSSDTIIGNTELEILTKDNDSSNLLNAIQLKEYLKKLDNLYKQVLANILKEREAPDGSKIIDHYFFGWNRSIDEDGLPNPDDVCHWALEYSDNRIDMDRDFDEIEQSVIQKAKDVAEIIWDAYLIVISPNPFIMREEIQWHPNPEYKEFMEWISDRDRCYHEICADYANWCSNGGKLLKNSIIDENGRHITTYFQQGYNDEEE